MCRFLLIIDYQGIIFKVEQISNALDNTSMTQKKHKKAVNYFFPLILKINFLKEYNLYTQ